MARLVRTLHVYLLLVDAVIVCADRYTSRIGHHGESHVAAGESDVARGGLVVGNAEHWHLGFPVGGGEIDLV